VPAAEPITPPSPALLALEGRAWLEFAALVPALPLLARAPRGDGHPVLVLPGWLASDRSTYVTGMIMPVEGGNTAGDMGYLATRLRQARDKALSA